MSIFLPCWHFSLKTNKQKKVLGEFCPSRAGQDAAVNAFSNLICIFPAGSSTTPILSRKSSSLLPYSHYSFLNPCPPTHTLKRVLYCASSLALFILGCCISTSAHSFFFFFDTENPVPMSPLKREQEIIPLDPGYSVGMWVFPRVGMRVSINLIECKFKGRNHSQGPHRCQPSPSVTPRARAFNAPWIPPLPHPGCSLALSVRQECSQVRGPSSYLACIYP